MSEKIPVEQVDEVNPATKQFLLEILPNGNINVQHTENLSLAESLGLLVVGLVKTASSITNAQEFKNLSSGLVVVNERLQFVSRQIESLAELVLGGDKEQPKEPAQNNKLIGMMEQMLNEMKKSG